MTPIEKVDKILEFFKSRTDNAGIGKEYLWNLYIQKTPELEINRMLYEEILKMLIADGYLRETNREDAQPTYNLTLKGLAFSGYNNRELEVQDLKGRTKRLERWNLILTTLIAIGTLVAAIYYVLEIINNCFSICSKH